MEEPLGTTEHHVQFVSTVRQPGSSLVFGKSHPWDVSIDGGEEMYLA